MGGFFGGKETNGSFVTVGEEEFLVGILGVMSSAVWVGDIVRVD